MGTRLAIEDIEWIQTQYPKMKICENQKAIQGELIFSRGYKGQDISDSYEVKISLEIEDGTILPKVYEISNKITVMAKENNKEMSDLHINPDGSFCLCIPEKEEELFENEFTIKEFFKKSLEPFLFQMSFYAKNSYLPWGEYAHGYLGHIETYAEGKIDFDKLSLLLNKDDILRVMNTNRQSICLCGSGKKLRKCHPLIFKGINKMKREFNINGHEIS